MCLWEVYLEMSKRQLQLWSGVQGRTPINGIGIHQWMAEGRCLAAVVTDETDQREHVELE